MPEFVGILVSIMIVNTMINAFVLPWRPRTEEEIKYFAGHHLPGKQKHHHEEHQPATADALVEVNNVLNAASSGAWAFLECAYLCLDYGCIYGRQAGDLRGGGDRHLKCNAKKAPWLTLHPSRAR